MSRLSSALIMLVAALVAAFSILAAAWSVSYPGRLYACEEALRYRYHNSGEIVTAQTRDAIERYCFKNVEVNIMAASQLDILRDKLFSKADADLRQRIDDKLDPLRQLATGINAIDVPAGSYTPVQIINHIADAAFDDRRDQVRNQVIDKFLARVAKLEA